MSLPSPPIVQRAHLELVDAALLVSNGDVLLADHRPQHCDLALQALDGLAQPCLLLEHALHLRRWGVQRRQMQ